MVCLALVGALVLMTDAVVHTNALILSELNNQTLILKLGAKPHFLAFCGADKLQSGYSIIKFDHVPTNTGNGYNKDTGYFTAPYDGVYLVGCVLVVKKETDFIYHIFKNNSPFTTGLISRTRLSNTNTQNIIMDLKKGDTVFIGSDVDGTLIGRRHSYFYGYMLN